MGAASTSARALKAAVPSELLGWSACHPKEGASSLPVSISSQGMEQAAEGLEDLCLSENPYPLHLGFGRQPFTFQTHHALAAS